MTTYVTADLCGSEAVVLIFSRKSFVLLYRVPSFLRAALLCHSPVHYHISGVLHTLVYEAHDLEDSVASLSIT